LIDLEMGQIFFCSYNFEQNPKKIKFASLTNEAGFCRFEQAAYYRCAFVKNQELGFWERTFPPSDPTGTSHAAAVKRADFTLRGRIKSGSYYSPGP